MLGGNNTVETRDVLQQIATSMNIQSIQGAEYYKYFRTPTFQNVMDWFTALKPSEKQSVLCITDSSWINKLKTLHSICSSEEGMFLYHEPSFKRNRRRNARIYREDFEQSILYKSWASFEKHSSDPTLSPRYNRSFLEATQRLLASVRVWDNETYADSIWINLSDHFVQTITLVLENGYRTMKIRLTDHESISKIHPGQTVQQIDQLKEQGDADLFTLAGFIAVRVFQGIMDRFNRRNDVQPSKLHVLFARLSDVWSQSQAPCELIRNDQHMRTRLDCLVKQSNDYTRKEYLAAYLQLRHELEENNILSDPRNIAELLFTSPLERIGSCFDVVAREIGHELHTIVADHALAALLDSSTEVPKSKKRSAKKKKSHKRTLQKEAAEIKTLATQVIQDVMERLYIAEDVQVPVEPSPTSTVEVVGPQFEQLLDHDIIEMATMLQNLASRRRPWQMCVINRLKECVTRLWPTAIVNVFGSFATGLSSPKSDIDLLISNIPHRSTTRKTSYVALFSQLLEQEPWIQSLEPIEQTIIPVIKLATLPVDSGGGLIHVDISFDQPEHRGLETCVFVQRLITNLPQLPPLVLVLKQFLIERGLNDSYTGGISSYGLTLMVASVLQPLQLIAPESRPSIGTLFIHFLRLFGVDFDPKESFIRTTHGGPIVALSLKFPRPNPADAVVIEDPLRPEQNAGKNCFGFRQVQLVFAHALRALEARRTDLERMWPMSQEMSALGAVFSAQHHIHVISLLQQIWCPDQPPQHHQITSLLDWSNEAYHLLAHFATQSNMNCPSCGAPPTTAIHSSSCPLQLLIESFQGLNPI